MMTTGTKNFKICIVIVCAILASVVNMKFVFCFAFFALIATFFYNPLIKRVRVSCFPSWIFNSKGMFAIIPVSTMFSSGHFVLPVFACNPDFYFRFFSVLAIVEWIKRSCLANTLIFCFDRISFHPSPKRFFIYSKNFRCC